MLLNNNTNGNYTMRQLKLPLEIEKYFLFSAPFPPLLIEIDFIYIMPKHLYKKITKVLFSHQTTQ